METKNEIRELAENYIDRVKIDFLKEVEKLLQGATQKRSAEKIIKFALKEATDRFNIYS